MRTCDSLGVCQGSKVPCLNCTDPNAPPWPPAEDTYTLIEQLAVPVAIAAALGVVVGVVYGVLRYSYPHLFH